MTQPHRHRTAREHATAATAAARVNARATTTQPEPDPPNAYITPAVAHAIRLRLQETRHARHT